MEEKEKEGLVRFETWDDFFNAVDDFEEKWEKEWKEEWENSHKSNRSWSLRGIFSDR